MDGPTQQQVVGGGSGFTDTRTTTPPPPAVTTTSSSRKRPRSTSPQAPSSSFTSTSGRVTKIQKDMIPSGQVFASKLRDPIQRNDALNSLLMISASHELNYALDGDEVLNELVNIAYEVLNWKDPQQQQQQQQESNKNDTANITTTSNKMKTTFFRSRYAWMKHTCIDTERWANHCLKELRKKSLELEKIKLLEIILIILRNLSFVAANLRLLAYSPTVLSILIGSLYECTSSSNLNSSTTIDESSSGGGSGGTTSTTSTSGTSSSTTVGTIATSTLALPALHTLVNLAPYLDVTGQKLFCDKLFLNPTAGSSSNNNKSDEIPLVPSSTSKFGQAADGSWGFGGLWLAKRLDTKEDSVQDVSNEMLIQLTYDYLIRIWSIFPALTKILIDSNSPRLVIMMAVDLLQEFINHARSISSVIIDNDNNNDRRSSSSSSLEEEGQEDDDDYYDDYYNYDNKDTNSNYNSNRTKTTTASLQKELPTIRSILIHVPTIVLERLMDLLYVPRLGPDALDYIDPVHHIVTRVTTLKLLMGYDATVDTDARDRALDVLVPLLELDSPRLAKRLGNVIVKQKPTKNNGDGGGGNIKMKNNNNEKSQNNNNSNTSKGIEQNQRQQQQQHQQQQRKKRIRMVRRPRNRLYDSLIPILMTQVGRNEAPLLASQLLKELAKTSENRIGLMYLQSRLVELASKDSRIAHLVMNHIYTIEEELTSTKAIAGSDSTTNSTTTANNRRRSSNDGGDENE